MAEGIDTTFVAGFNDAADPADVWKVDAIYLDPRWMKNQDPLADFAIPRVCATVAVRSKPRPAVASRWVRAQDRARWSPSPDTGWASAAARSAARRRTELAPGGFPSLPCAGLVDGTSGAPWIAGSTITGLVGGLDGGGCDENVSYSPPFDDGVVQLLTRAEAGGPG